MNTLNNRIAVLAIVLGTASLPVLASSTASSAGSDGSSASSGSVSDSFGTSSDSSTKTVTAGNYKVMEVAKVADRPGTLRITLQPVADNSDENAFFLYVPEQTLRATPVAVGQVLSARDKPYGIEFAKADTGKAFFLVLEDKWYRELQSNVVTL
jgi:hypothetical protein